MIHIREIQHASPAALDKEVNKLTLIQVDGKLELEECIDKLNSQALSDDLDVPEGSFSATSAQLPHSSGWPLMIYYRQPSMAKTEYSTLSLTVTLHPH